MTPEYENYLAHYGIKGQKWGQRNYQNYDGSYTQEGALRYWGGNQRRPAAGLQKTSNDGRRNDAVTSQQKEARKQRAKTILKIAAGVSIAALAAYAYSTSWRNAYRRNYSATAEIFNRPGDRRIADTMTRRTALKMRGDVAKEKIKAASDSAKNWMKNIGVKLRERQRDHLIRADRRREKLSEFKTKGKMAATATAGAAFIYARYIRKDDPNKKKRK